jgi:hypothetical protein
MELIDHLLIMALLVCHFQKGKSVEEDMVSSLLM